MSVRNYLIEADNRYNSTAKENKEIMKDTLYGVLEDVLIYAGKASSDQEIVKYIKSIMEEIE